MEFKTSISKITENEIIIRGETLSSLIEKNSFTDAVFLIILGRSPTETESKIFSAMLISIIDHGMGTTSSLTTRFVTSGGNSLNTAVSAGIAALGDYHGGAIENSMKQLKSVIDLNIKNKDFKTLADNFVSDCLENKKVLFGFGHKVYKEKDPRVKKILEICEQNNFKSDYLTLLKELEKSLEEKKGKKIIINVDGIIAAILLEMGFSISSGKGIFIIGRVPGLVAQGIEEKENEKPVRRVDEKDINYTGN